MKPMRHGDTFTGIRFKDPDQIKVLYSSVGNFKPRNVELWRLIETEVARLVSGEIRVHPSVRAISNSYELCIPAEYAEDVILAIVATYEEPEGTQTEQSKLYRKLAREMIIGYWSECDTSRS